MFTIVRPARFDLLRGVLTGKLQLDAGVETVLTDVRIRELRTLIPSETLNALSGRNYGTFVEQREGVHGVRLVFHVVDFLPLGLLVNELGGYLKRPSASGWKGSRVSTVVSWKGRRSPQVACFG